MKKALLGTLLFTLQGCVNSSSTTTVKTALESELEPELASGVDTASACIGSTALYGELHTRFKPIKDTELLAQAIGEPLKGKLCQGTVYQSTQEVTIYRAWNSTNPNSQFGQWWSFQYPSGTIADYRKNYEICYQWSPLDKLVQCTLKIGTNVVVGNGQSEQCSEYLSYPVSAKQQVFIAASAGAVENCQSFNGIMRWQ
ncbi:hypothetical protein J8L98_24265 [Pseudoalteromonas sp. MMG013]|uniref:hypothetical protein n=1 Tax=Pseudoalteromonas sp. MMG013 TaxID=2822687 RepID=UPI001B38ADB3|nr:hypothetical protein [Pseudoalteromonas sp. MMG013]MBQ4864803.1 hypothetical protein [Pseudoalteromonas sp. MMG013]